MKRVRDELAGEELPYPRKVAKSDSSHASLPAQASYRGKDEEDGENDERVCPGRCKQGEPVEGEASHAGGSQSNQNEHEEEMGWVAREDDEENTSLLDHQDPRVRLRALTALHAHIDLLSCDAAGTDRLSQALHSRLHREDNPHVAQQIVRLMASLVIFICKRDGGRQSDNAEHCSKPKVLPSTGIEHISNVHEHGNIATSPCSNHNHSSHSNAEEVISFCYYCKQPAVTESLLIDHAAFCPTPEPALHTVKTVLSCGLAETESLTLKLQTLRSLYQIVEETGAVPLISLRTLLPELLASSNPYIRAHTLQLVAMVMVTSTDTEYTPSKEDSLGLFEEYTHDSNAFVRKSSLQSFVLLGSNSYMLTNGCYQAALTLLQDLNASVRTLALQVVSLWVRQDPEERTNDAFLQVCKMMTDMELCVRIEACKALSTMSKIREDLLLQALSKQPLELSAQMQEPQSSSLITISESDVDISQYEQGLSILDKLNIGAFVHGIEDEFYEVRALTLNALARFCCGSARARAAIIEVLINLVNDDSEHVRLKAVHALIHVAHQYGLHINDNDLQTVQGTLEDIDGAIRDTGKTLLASVQFSSVDGFKSTVESLMNYMQRSRQEEDVRHALYKLGKAHSTYVQVLAKDLLKELKGSLSGEAGLDAPECGCILLLFVAASESNPNIVSLVPSHILSLARLLRQGIAQKCVMLKTISTDFQAEMSKRLETSSVAGDERCPNTDVTSTINSAHRRKVDDFLACTVRNCWNVKNLLVSGMISTSRQVLSGCTRDLKMLLNGLGDENQAALATYVVHFVECIDFVSQGLVYFQQKGRKAAATIPSLPDLACRLEFVVKCMQHTYVGHTSEQKLDLLELSVIPALWRMTCTNVYGKLVSTVEFIKSTIGLGSTHTPFLQEIKEKLLEARALSSSIDDVRKIVCKLVSTFWPRLLTIGYVRERKAALTIPGNDMDHPTEFVPNMPFGITVSIFTKNLENSKIWVCMQLDSLWKQFIFLDAEDYRRGNPFVTNLQIHGVSKVLKCTLNAAILLECPGLIHDPVDRGPEAFLPLSPVKLIHLQSASTAIY